MPSVYNTLKDSDSLDCIFYRPNVVIHNHCK